MTSPLETVIFGGGCFWCTEAVFKMLKGVLTVTPGYAGGATTDPSYEQVSGGATGHAEVIRIEYDPSQTTFHDLLTVFFATHDPTTPNRQGADIGTQYRSIILTTTDKQKAEACAFIADLNASSAHGALIVTEVQPLTTFTPAEIHHQDYYTKNSEQPYCQVVIQPKLEKVKKDFVALLKNPSLS